MQGENRSLIPNNESNYEVIRGRKRTTRYDFEFINTIVTHFWRELPNELKNATNLNIFNKQKTKIFWPPNNHVKSIENLIKVVYI